jgi:hypothetical protein
MFYPFDRPGFLKGQRTGEELSLGSSDQKSTIKEKGPRPLISDFTPLDYFDSEKIMQGVSARGSEGVFSSPLWPCAPR